ncbi:TPA: oxidoreductase [Yersinia enterocolitica]|uniref:oxidoreductase n=1 Tax=Yersinia enterocolitica TaxID=630 RepID=UPI0032F74EB6|nr:oxidoreductase [Yersinia enterocolitica]HDL6972386.1 oxidoreductase [Yersinia enterocolitica]HDL6976099.1 oxidoreductase [Yersinia enterocolitica]HDL6988993.1 oxidoreductase [Yersinia enterocolitica]HDL6997654.1 oxidoreductase [Yersinia enterocolitica]
MANDGFVGQVSPTSNSSPTDAMNFFMKQFLVGVRTAALVVVKGVTNDGGVSPVGYVDIQPLVTQLDGSGNVVSHGTIYDVPYLRVQGGANAMIIDPEIGDMGIAIISDRDISAVKAAKAESPPGSTRRFNLSDSMYMGGLLNGSPSQYLRYYSGGIELVSPIKVTIFAPEIENNASTSFTVNSPSIVLNGAVEQGSGSYAGDASFSGTVNADVDVIAAGISVVNHPHSDVQPGTGNSGKPIPS